VLKDAHLVVWIIECIGGAGEPIFERERDFAQIVLLDHVFIPDDELDRTELICEREIYGEVKRRVLGWPDRVERAFDNGCLVARAEHGYDDKPGH
jgi:hypothetical protein